jgi:DNA polymerase-3 subunit alpha
LFIVRALAGYSLGQADIFRKAMGKKIAEVMKKERRNFTAGAKKNGFTSEEADAVFNLIEPFAGYAFNKAHATSYALIAYQTAYLKANYPAEYMTGFLVTQSDQQDKVASAVTECRRLGITVLPPDINHSQDIFTIAQDSQGSPAIRFGLSAIKNVGSGAVAPVIAERDRDGEFKSVEDFCRRADLHGVNKRVMESLIKAGALDCLGERGTLLANVGRIISLAQRQQRLRESGQAAMFDLWGEEAPVPMPGLEMEETDIPVTEKLAWEKDMLGVYISEHPLSSVRIENATLCGQIDAEMKGQTVRTVGMVASVHSLFTRDRQSFISAVLEDLDGSVEVMVWPNVYASTKELWVEGSIVLVEGKVREREGRIQLNCDRAEQYRPGIAKKAAESVSEEGGVSEEKVPVAPKRNESHRLVISLAQTGDEDSDIASLRRLIEVLNVFPGDDEVNLSIVNQEQVVHLQLPNMRSRYCPELHQRLAELVGEDGIRLEEKGART